MKIEDIKQVVVIGAGMMGAQIAQQFSQAGGYAVNITDVNESVLKNGIQFIHENLQKYFVDKGKMTAAEMAAITGRIKPFATIPEAVKNADFVIEAVYENMDLKKTIFKQVDENAPSGAILASNSSYLNTSEMGSATNRKDKMVGMHFFNPIAVMKLVEVVRSPLTSDETVEITKAVANRLKFKILRIYFREMKTLRRRLTFPGMGQKIEKIISRLRNTYSRQPESYKH